MKTNLKIRPACRALLALPVALLACASLHAQSLSFEPFTGYTVGMQLPANTPSPTVAGYTGDWTSIDFGSLHPNTIAGSLVYTTTAGYAAGIGNSIGIAAYTGGISGGNSGRMYRLLDSSLMVDGSTTGTRYMSFLFKSGHEHGATVFQMLDLYNGDTADADRTLTAGVCNNAGQSGNQYNFAVTEAYSSTGVAVDANVHLFVVKFDLSASAASDTVTVWLDPILGAGDPAGGVVVSGKDIAFDRLTISDYSNGNSGNWDEIRWGTDFNSVTIVAPPAPTVYQPVFSASPRFVPVGQSIPLTVTIDPSANASSTVTLVLTNENPGVISLPGGNPTTLTFNAGATNVQVLNVSVVGAGVGSLTVITNSTFSLASIQLGSTISVLENFNYPAGSENLITDGTGGTGFSGPWNTAGSVVEPGLSYGSLVTSSNTASVDQENTFRPLLGTYGGTGGGTVWISFLVQGNETFPANMYCGLSLFQGTGSENLFMGMSTYESNNGKWGFKSGTAYFNLAGSVVPGTNTDFLVYRIDFPPTNGGPATVTFYADPVPGTTEPLVPTASATVNSFAFDTLRIGEGGASTLPKYYDEIRIGTSWTNVVTFVGPPPPPAPALAAPVWVAPVGQDVAVMLTIPTNVNASSTVNITITNDNPSAFSLSPGNAASVTLTFAAGAANVQTFNARVLATGSATLTVVSNASINTASTIIGSQAAAYEPFEYDTTANTGLPLDAGYGYTGGLGFGGEWGGSTPANQNATIVSGLTYAGLITSSNAANTTGSPVSVGFVEGRALRALDKTYGGTGGGTVWASFLVQAANAFAANENFGGLSLFNSGTEELLMGLSAYEPNNGMYGFKRNSGQLFQNFTNSVAPGTNTALLVYRFDFPVTNGDLVTVTFYANPTLGATPPAIPTGSASVDNFTFNSIRVACDNNMTFDELRLGGSWGEVVATPTLGIQRLGGSQVQIGWPAVVTGMSVYSSTNLLGPWLPTGLSVTNVAGQKIITDTVSGSAKFYRLQ